MSLNTNKSFMWTQHLLWKPDPTEGLTSIEESQYLLDIIGREADLEYSTTLPGSNRKFEEGDE